MTRYIKDYGFLVEMTLLLLIIIKLLKLICRSLLTKIKLMNAMSFTNQNSGTYLQRSIYYYNYFRGFLYL